MLIEDALDEQRRKSAPPAVPNEGDTPAQVPDMPEPEQQPAQPAAQDEGDTPDPREADALKRLVLACVALLHGVNPANPKDESTDSIRQGIVESMKARSDTPSEALADTTAMLIIEAEKKGKNVPQEILLPAVAHVLPQVADAARDYGAFDATEQDVQKAVPIACMILLKHFKASPEEIQQFVQEHGGQQMKSGPAPDEEQQPEQKPEQPDEEDDRLPEDDEEEAA